MDQLFLGNPSISIKDKINANVNQKAMISLISIFYILLIFVNYFESTYSNENGHDFYHGSLV